MSFGLEDGQFAILNNLLIQPLKKANYSLWVFGSRARGDHHPYSDIDILYSSNHEKRNPTLIGDIEERLQDSNLTIKVDLVQLEDLAASYKESVFKDRIPL